MDYALENGDSSDEDFSENLQLAERLRIHRGENKIGNGRRKKMFLDDQSSSSSSLEVRNDTSQASTSGSFATYNKKRQNGDKNAEPFANPKRTCLSSRSRKPHDCHHKKKVYNNGFHVDNHQSVTINSARRNLFPDKTYEDHIHNSETFEPTASNHCSIKRIHSKQSKPLEDVAYLTPINSEHYHSQTNQQLELDRDKSESSDSESSKQFLWRGSENRVGEHSRSVENETLAISEFIAPNMPPQFYQNHFSPVHSDTVVHYVDSASDEDSRSMITKGSLKGGRQSPELSQRPKKVVGRKVKKILDSDDTDDDDYPIFSRGKPRLIFSSSDSEVENGMKTMQKSTPSESIPNHSIPVGNNTSSKNQFTCHPPGESFRSACFARDGCFAGATCSTPPPFYNSRNSTRHCRNRKNNRSNAATSDIAPVNYHTIRNNGTTVRNRSRVGASERYNRRSGSPHPSSLPNSHPRLTRSEAAKSAKGRSLTGSYTRRANLNLATTYPDLFDAEDSSEVEFFTANSYSDTETSAESFGGLRISATVMNGENDDQSIHIGSSEDEISVVFSTGPSTRNVEQRRGTSRALGRRHNRGSRRHLPNPQEIISLSPDPVEQVRQVEDDERFARMLQAQFDAEVDPSYVPIIPDPPLPQLDIAPPIFETDTEFEDNIDTVHRWDSSPPVLHPNMSPTGYRRGPRVNRFPIRFNSPSLFESIYYNNRRLDRNRRRLNNHDTRNHIARIFETSLFGRPLTDILSSEDSFETNIGIVELNGDVPRGLQRGEINRLPTRKFVTASITDSSNSLAQVPHKRSELNKECQVCLSDYENGDTLRILPCFHEFHTPCIDPWLKINHTCPVCRVVVDLGG